MKIALIYDRVYPWLKGGGEKALWDIACELRALGHEVHYFGTKLWNGNHRIVRDGIVLHGVSRPAKFYNAEGRRSIFQPLIFSAGLFRALWRMRDADFNLINCTVFPFFSVFAVWLFRALSGRRIPWVLNWLEVWGAHYWREYFGSNVAGAIGYAIEWVCARSCKVHLVISPLQARRLRDLLGVPPNCIHIIPRGLHLPLPPKANGKHRHRVIYAGRLAPYKNVESVLRAWPKIIERHPVASFRVFGSGPSYQGLENLVRELGIGKSVQILPPTESGDEIMREIAAAEILVQPSIREGQSVVVIEAMASRTVVVASRHEQSAVSDLIVDGRNGILIDRWNKSEAWSRALVQLLDSVDLRSKLADEALRTASEYDWAAKIIPRLDAFHRVLTGSSAVEIPEVRFCNRYDPIPIRR